ncbi:MAG: hypothetical protein ACP5E4_04360, partial [Candidatus Aenigmatarchaeota archaeon]
APSLAIFFIAIAALFVVPKTRFRAGLPRRADKVLAIALLYAGSSTAVPCRTASTVIAAITVGTVFFVMEGLDLFEIDSPPVVFFNLGAFKVRRIIIGYSGVGGFFFSGAVTKVVAVV